MRAILITLTAFLIVGCSTPETKTETKKIATPTVQHLKWHTPANNKRIATGDSLRIDWDWKDIAKADSVVLFIGNNRLQPVTKNQSVQIPLYTKTGMQQMILKSYVATKNTSTQKNIEFVPGIDPVKSKAAIIRKLKHDDRAYTQGLEIHGGFFYESTGQLKESTMRKVEIESGKVLNTIKLNDDAFGEGMTIFNDKIFQLTWQSNIGYVYDLKTFKLLYEFEYPTEGWGLTNDGKNLIMSDGSYYIYLLDPEYFTEVNRISVYNNRGPVTRLNELEYINGKILSNVYGADYIVTIDPKTGITEQEIDLSMLKNAAKLPPHADVLNGLAWDKKNNKLYATGKYWPTMFEISIEGF